MCKHVSQRTRFLISWYVADWSGRDPDPIRKHCLLIFKKFSDQDIFTPWNALFSTFFKQKRQFDTYLMPFCYSFIDLLNDSSAQGSSI